MQDLNLHAPEHILENGPMAKKLEFDWKNFLLQKGEKVGLGVGVAVLLLMGFFGVKGVFSGSPSHNAKELNDRTKRANDLLVNNKPTNMDEFKVDPSIKVASTLPPVDREQFQELASMFVPFAPEDNKRRQPKIEQPVEMTPTVALAQVRVFSFQDDGKRIGVLRGEDVKGDKNNLTALGANLQNMLGGPGGAGKGAVGGGRGMMTLNPGLVGVGAQGASTRPSTGVRSGAGGTGKGMRAFGTLGDTGLTAATGSGDKGKKEPAFIPIEELEKHSDVRPMHKVFPARMVIVEGSFPLKKQLEDMKSALHNPTLADAYKELHFAGFNIERREIDRAGKPVGDWYPVSDEPFRVIMRNAGKQTQKEDPKLDPVILPGLVMALPEQFEREYPSVHANLKELKKAIDALEARGDVQETPKNTQFDVGEGDLFVTPGGGQNAAAGTGTVGAGEVGLKGAGGGLKGGAGTVKTNPPAVPVAPGAASGIKGGARGGAMGVEGGPAGASNANWEPPEYVLVRFVDVTVEPGKTYEYRYQIKIKNPNEGRDKEVAYKDLAKQRYVNSPWFELGQRVNVPADFHYYAVDMKELQPREYFRYPLPNKDQVALQLERWVDVFEPPGSRTNVPVGDWAVADRILVNRGEFVGGKYDIELPIWDSFEEQFLVYTNPSERRRRAAQRVAVPFTESDSESPILVDFSGGTISFTKPEERRPVEDKGMPREVLFLSPEGRLVVRNSLVDAKDAEREKHLQEYQTRLREAKDTNKPDQKKPQQGGAATEGGAFGKGGGKQ